MCPALLNHGLPSVGLHPPLFLLSPPLSSISLSALHALQALLTRTLRIIYQNYPNSLLTCPASLSLSLILTPASSSFHCFWEQFTPPSTPSLFLPPPLLLIHPKKPVSKSLSSLSLSVLLVSKAPEATVIHWLTFLCYI